MSVIWDPKKAKTNLEKHDIHFSDIEAVFFDPYSLTKEDKNAEGEQRFVTIGMDSLFRIIVVIYAYKGEDTRLISARKATKKERNAYEKGIRFR